jgi:protein required for attachment to host cells
MTTTWVVAADSSVCRIFEAGEPAGALQELEVLTHPEARLRARELVSDRPGRTFDSKGAGRHAKEAPVGPKRHEAMVFAGRIADRLEAGRVAHAFDRLALVAAPKFLGLLRERLTPQVRARIVHEIAKNLSRRGAETIAARVPGVGAGETPPPGRRARKPGSARRAPMAPFVPRPLKRASGRTPAALVPAHIRSRERLLAREDRAYIRRRLGMKLGKFAPQIERVTVRAEDVNGPRGGRDMVCRVKVVLSGLPSVVVEERGAKLRSTLDRALDRTERAVRRSLGRRSTGRRSGGRPA